jgi:DivIVA domain-containing protein
MAAMEVSPQAIATTTFRVVKKGYDPDEVRAYLGELSRAVDTAQSHAQAMEARARQAVAKAERLASAVPVTKEAPPEQIASNTEASPIVAEDQPLPSGADVISRTLLMAQQMADDTVARANRDAAALKAEAESHAQSVRASADATAAQKIDQARLDAKTTGDQEKSRIEGEIHQLLAKLEFLRGDVQQLELHAAAHRERLLDSSAALKMIAEQPTGGFASVRWPVLSSVSDSMTAAPASDDITAEIPSEVVAAATELDDVPQDADSTDGDATAAASDAAAADSAVASDIAAASDMVVSASLFDVLEGIGDGSMTSVGAAAGVVSPAEVFHSSRELDADITAEVPLTS